VATLLMVYHWNRPLRLRANCACSFLRALQVDGSKGEFLASAIDQRLGGMAMSGAAQWQWGVAENATNCWSDKISIRLLELQGRAPTAQSAQSS